MATAGIIETTRTWLRVVNPDTATPPSQPVWRRLLNRKQHRRWTPTAIHRSDFLTPDITVYADKLVNDVKTIAESRTVAEGFLGHPDTATRALVATLYRQLVAMASADSAVLQAEEVRAGHHDMEEAHAMISQMEKVVDENFSTNVVAVSQQMEDLTKQVKLLDLQLRIPEMVASMRHDPSKSLENVTAQISALCDLPLN